MGWDGMGRNGTGPRGTADSVNASLRSFSSFSRSPFLLHPCSPSFSSSLLFHSTHTFLRSSFCPLYPAYDLSPLLEHIRHSFLPSFSLSPVSFVPFNRLSSLHAAFGIGLFPMLFSVPAGHCKAGGVCERRDTMLCLRTAGLTYFVC